MTRTGTESDARGNDSTTTDGIGASGWSLTRRRALALAGGAVVGTAAMGPAGASSHNAEVYKSSSSPSGDTFAAKNLDTGEIVYEGEDYINAMQAAVDSLTDGRTSKEKVLVKDSGDTGSHRWDGDTKGVDLWDYTVFECASGVTINVTDRGDDLIIPVRVRGNSHVDIPNVNITGNPRYGMEIQSADDVSIGSADIRIPDSTDVGIGIRIDDGGGTRSTNITIDYAYVEASPGHGVETYGVDYFDVTTAVETVDTGGCGLLLNDTADATVAKVDATRADQGGGYAGFRAANYAGPNVTVNEVSAVDCGRGIFTVSGCDDITINNVYLDGNGGNLIQDTRNSVVDGGTIKNTGSSGIRIDSRDSNDHPHTKNVTVKNLDITDNDKYGVYETGPDTECNTITKNYFCNNASGAIELYSSCTEVTDNTYC